MVDPSAVGLTPSLRTRNPVLFGVVAMAPIAGVTAYGFVSASSGGAVIGATAFSFAAMAEAAPGAGSVHGIASHAMGRFMGFRGGWAILLDDLPLTALVIVFGAYCLTGALPFVPRNAAVAVFAVSGAVVSLAGPGVFAVMRRVRPR